MHIFLFLASKKREGRINGAKGQLLMEAAETLNFDISSNEEVSSYT